MLIVQKNEAIVYDGTNGAAIAGEWLVDVALVSDDGQTLVIETPGWPEPNRYEIAKDSYVIAYEGRQFRESLPPTEFVKRWQEITV